MYLNIILTLILIVLITIPTLILVWWFRTGKKLFNQIKTSQKTLETNPFSQLGNLAQMMEGFKNFNRK